MALHSSQETACIMIWVNSHMLSECLNSVVMIYIVFIWQRTGQKIDIIKSTFKQLTSAYSFVRGI